MSEEIEEPLEPEKERLVQIIARTCRELRLPGNSALSFTDEVACHAKEMLENNRVFDDIAVFDAINAYEYILLNLEGCQYSPLDLYAYAETTAGYYMAREAILKNDSLRRLFDFDEGRRVN